MNFFEQELRRFTGKTTAFKSCKALYTGRACFIPLSGSRRARLEVGTDGVHTVLPPVDAARDDSTALAALPQETLARLLLPLGEFDAGDLAELAQELQL